MDRTKKVLITLLVVGALATVGVGTYATFNAQTTNAGNTFTTGTIVLSDNSPASLCYSAGTASGTIAGGNVNGACGAVAFASLAKPGDTSTPADFTLTNVGSLAAGSGLTVQAGSCTDAAGGGTFNASPTGNPLCGALGIQIQGYNSTFTTPLSSCVYPYSATTACGTNFGTLSGLATAQSVVSSLAAGSSAYDAISLNLPSSAGNSVQGLTSSFSLTFTLAQ